MKRSGSIVRFVRIPFKHLVIQSSLVTGAHFVPEVIGNIVVVLNAAIVLRSHSPPTRLQSTGQSEMPIRPTTFLNQVVRNDGSIVHFVRTNLNSTLMVLSAVNGAHTVYQLVAVGHVAVTWSVSSVSIDRLLAIHMHNIGRLKTQMSQSW